MTLKILAGCAVVAAVAGCGDNLKGQPDAGPVAAADAPAGGPAPGITLYSYPIAVDVSPDGTKAVFEDITTETLAVTVDTRTLVAGTPVVVGDPSLDIANGVADDGRIAAIHGNPAKAGSYDPATMTWRDLVSPYATSCDPNVSGGFDISGAGTTIVGLLWDGCVPVAFRADTATGAVTPLTLLGTPNSGVGHATNRATVISDDGKVIAGFAENKLLDRSAAVWNADGTGLLIDAVQQDAPSEFHAINGDGSVLAGTLGYDAFVWTKAGGSVPIPRPDSALPSDPQFPNAITGDGKVVFGGVGDAFASIPVAFMWSKAYGTRPLLAVALEGGLAIPDGTLLNSVLGVSADGTVVIGTAMDAMGTPKTFLLRLPAYVVH